MQKATGAKQENAVMSASISKNGRLSNTEELTNQLRNNGINIQEEQLEEHEDMWVYNKNSDIIYYIYKDGIVLKDDLSTGKLPTGIYVIMEHNI